MQNWQSYEEKKILTQIWIQIQNGKRFEWFEHETYTLRWPPLRKKTSLTITFELRPLGWRHPSCIMLCPQAIFITQPVHSIINNKRNHVAVPNILSRELWSSGYLLLFLQCSLQSLMFLQPIFHTQLAHYAGKISVISTLHYVLWCGALCSLTAPCTFSLLLATCYPLKQSLSFSLNPCIMW